MNKIMNNIIQNIHFNTFILINYILSLQILRSSLSFCAISINSNTGRFFINHILSIGKTSSDKRHKDALAVSQNSNSDGTKLYLFQKIYSKYDPELVLINITYVYEINSVEEEFDESDDYELPAGSESDPEEQLLRKQTAMKIHRILHDLKEPYKEVFQLRTFGDLSFAEIGELFSKSESWARVTFYRAKQKLLEGMKQNGL